MRRGKVTAIRPDRVEFELSEAVAQSKQTEITVAISIFKFDRMEWAIEKCVELGVARIIPVIAGRTEKHLAAAATRRVERWRRIVQQSSEQSRRSSVPEIAEPMKIKDLFALATDTKIILSEVEHELMLKQTIPPGANFLLLAFGPEGGWTEQELSSFSEAVSLLFRNAGGYVFLAPPWSSALYLLLLPSQANCWFPQFEVLSRPIEDRSEL